MLWFHRSHYSKGMQNQKKDTPAPKFAAHCTRFVVLINHHHSSIHALTFYYHRYRLDSSGFWAKYSKQPHFQPR
jgi:hypothetical protein